MPRRNEQLAHALRDAVGHFLQKEIEFPNNVLVTVTGARISHDARAATMLISVLPKERGEEILQNLEDERYALQGMIHRTVDRHPAPAIQFELTGDPPDASDQHSLGVSAVPESWP